jgi:hypothetical protein
MKLSRSLTFATLALILTVPLFADAADSRLPRILSFSASPQKAVYGQSVKLSWKVENADGCNLRYYNSDERGGGSGYITSGKAVDSYVVNPQYTTTYEIQCVKGTSIDTGIGFDDEKLTVTIEREAKTPSITVKKVRLAKDQVAIQLTYKNLPKNNKTGLVLKKQVKGQPVNYYPLKKGGSGTVTLKLGREGSLKGPGYDYVVEVQGAGATRPVTESFFIPGNVIIDGLTITDTVIGSGTEARAGRQVTVSYVGKLENGTVFDASDRHGGTKSFTFLLGAGQVIEGWDRGVAGMREGGSRRIKISPDLAYGSQGVPGVIPGNATLIFDIKLLHVE